MRFEIDQVKCKTNGICVREIPNIFRFLHGSKKGNSYSRAYTGKFERKMPCDGK